MTTRIMKISSARILWSLTLVAGMVLLACNSRGAAGVQPARRSGTVVDDKGAPVTDATVDCYQFPTQITFNAVDFELKLHATTDSKGSFALPAPVGTFVLIAKKAGVATSWK